MLGKKTCPRCKKSLKGSYDFCPFCGNPLELKNEDFGMLGKTDASHPNLNGIRLPVGLNSLFGSLMKNLEKQFKEIDKNPKEDNKRNISISISTFPGFPQQIKMNPPEERKNVKKSEDIKKFFFNNLSSESFQKFPKLTKTEPKTEMRREDNKIFYDVNLPGVKSIKDVSILALENSMELKAVSEKKAYSKRISISLPIVNYKFSKGKLTLEFDASGN